MNTNGRRACMLALSLGAVVAVVATATVAPAAAAAGSGTTYTVKTVKMQGSVWIAGGGKAMSPGHLSAGNRLFETDAVRRDDGPKGVFVGTVLVASPGTVAAGRAVGLMRGVYRFGDGDLYVDGVLSFASSAGTGVVVGGTGTYAGARGTFTATEAKVVLHVLA
jgi:hypothetical protein